MSALTVIRKAWAASWPFLVVQFLCIVSEWEVEIAQLIHWLWFWLTVVKANPFSLCIISMSSMRRCLVQYMLECGAQSCFRLFWSYLLYSSNIQRLNLGMQPRTDLRCRRFSTSVLVTLQSFNFKQHGDGCGCDTTRVNKPTTHRMQQPASLPPSSHGPFK